MQLFRDIQLRKCRAWLQLSVDDCIIKVVIYLFCSATKIIGGKNKITLYCSSPCRFLHLTPEYQAQSGYGAEHEAFFHDTIIIVCQKFVNGNSAIQTGG